MGMEALETVVGYWEDALNAYQANANSKQKLLTTSEEAEFTKMLENILESAYQLQVKPIHLEAKLRPVYGTVHCGSVLLKRAKNWCALKVHIEK
jgi:hypothetical protein